MSRIKSNAYNKCFYSSVILSVHSFRVSAVFAKNEGGNPVKTSVRIFSMVVFLMMLITSGCGPSAHVDISPAMTMVAFQQTATAAVPINRSIHLTPTASIPITGADTAQAGLENLQLTPTPGNGT